MHLITLLIFVDATFGYPGQPKLFNKVDFGIDMTSRGKAETLSFLTCGLYSSYLFVFSFSTE